MVRLICAVSAELMQQAYSKSPMEPKTPLYYMIVCNACDVAVAGPCARIQALQDTCMSGLIALHCIR